jgi:hypothetical protein
LVQEISLRFNSSISLYDLDSSDMGQSMEQTFQYQNKDYRLAIVQQDTPVLRLFNSSDNSYKDVTALPNSKHEDWELLGGLISPYEKRAALVVFDRVRGIHRVFGSHLTLSFQSLNYHAGDLIEAVLCGQYYICRLLLSQGVSPEEADPRGYSPLLLSARNGKWDIAMLLLDQGVSVSLQDDRGNRALHYAVMAGQLPLVRKLCEAGSSPQWKNLQGRSALDLARGQGAMESLLRSFL